MIKTYSGINADTGYIWPSGGASVYDSTRNKIWYPTIVGVGNDADMYNLKIDASSGEIEKKVENWQTKNCNYDKSLDKIVGINFYSYGKNENNYSYILEQANPATLQLTGNFNSFFDHFCDAGGVNALDSVNGIVYQLIYRNRAFNETTCAKQYNSQYTALFAGYLIGVDAKTGEYLTHVQICIDSKYCPWSMQFWEYKNE